MLECMNERMLSIFLSLVSGIVLGACATVQDEDDETQFHAALEEAAGDIREAVENEDSVPGASLAIVDRKGILHADGFGTLAADSNEPVSTETVFSIQSTSKTFTGVAVMLAVQDGYLDLDAPVSEYLPDFVVNSRFEDAPERRMTLRHLLSHTAGFTHEAPVGNNIDARSPSFDAHVESIGETWLRAPVGERYFYSNLGIDLAGYILQDATGVPFETYVRERILEPLGMDDSFVDTPDHHGGHCAACARGHDPGFVGLPDYIPLTASGGVRVSAEDGARFVRFMLKQGELEGERLLEPELMAEMVRPAAARHKAFPGLDDAHYGLGVYSYPVSGTYAVNHDGGGFGFRASMKWYPEYGVGYVLLINSAAGSANQVWNPVWNLLHELIEEGMIEPLQDDAIASAEEQFSEAPGRQKPRRIEDLDPGKVKPVDDPDSYTGDYKARFGGGFEPNPEARVPAWDISVSEEDGVLYLDSIDSEEAEPLVKHKPELFFGALTGEALDFRGDEVRWRNIPMEAAIE